MYIFSSFCLLTHLGANNIEARGVFNNTLLSGTNSRKKRNVVTLNSAAHIKQKRCVTCVAG